MKNKFVVITTCYNVEPYIRINMCMHRFQNYEKALFVYVDDSSTDTTWSTIQDSIRDDSRFIALQNPNSGSQAKAYMHAIEYLEKSNLIADEDIIVEVDGDDWLADNFVLEHLDGIYSSSETIWMTYGQYVKWPDGEVGGHYSMYIDASISYTNTFRQYPFAFSHLKTYKYWLFNKIDRKDLLDPATGEYFTAAWDHALCLPMVEMAGWNRIHRVPHVTYILNRVEGLQNEGRARVGEQKAIEARIRQGRVYSRL